MKLGKRRCSLQTMVNTVLRTRRQIKTVILPGAAEQESVKKAQKQLFYQEMRTFLLTSLMIQIEEIEEWNKDKDDIIGRTLGILDTARQPTAEKGVPIRSDEQPQVTHNILVWRKMALNTCPQKRISMLTTGLTKINFFQWGREKIVNLDPVIPLNNSTMNEDPEDGRLSQLRRQYLTRLKVTEQFDASAKKSIIDVSIDDKIKLKASPKTFTFDYNGKRILHEKKKDISYTFQPGQFSVKDYTSEQKSPSIEKIQKTKTQQDERYRNYIKDIKKNREKCCYTVVIPNHLEKGVAVYQKEFDVKKKEINKTDISYESSRQSAKVSLHERGKSFQNKVEQQNVPKSERKNQILSYKAPTAKLSSLKPADTNRENSKFLQDLSPTLKFPKIHS